MHQSAAGVCNPAAQGENKAYAQTRLAAVSAGRPGLRPNVVWRRAREPQRTPAFRGKVSGSPEDTDLERISLGGPRIEELRELFVIECGAQ